MSSCISKQNYFPVLIYLIMLMKYTLCDESVVPSYIKEDFVQSAIMKTIISKLHIKPYL